MKLKQFLNKVFAFCATILFFCILYVLAIYLLLFVPNFTRNDPTEEQNKVHFFTEENYARYESERVWFWNQRPDTISIESFDGLKLVAYTLKSEIEPKGTVLLMHGHHSDPIREFTGIARFYHESGYNIVLPFQRTHGASEGKYITFGVKESRDLLEWTRKINEIYGEEKPLFLHGISMGCATVLMSLSFNLPQNVRAVVADCGFTSPQAIIYKTLTHDKKIPTANLVIKVGDFFARILAGFSFNEKSTLDAIEVNKKRENQIPILFIHGGADETVPLDMSGENFMRAEGSFVQVHGAGAEFMPNKQADKYLFVQIADAPHAISFLVDEKKYSTTVSTFLSKYGIQNQKSEEK